MGRKLRGKFLCSWNGSDPVQLTLGAVGTQSFSPVGTVFGKGRGPNSPFSSLFPSLLIFSGCVDRSGTGPVWHGSARLLSGLWKPGKGSKAGMFTSGVLAHACCVYSGITLVRVNQHTLCSLTRPCWAELSEAKQSGASCKPRGRSLS